ncbi:MAG: radical SAM protein, partial [Anaerolineales bacterium]
MKLVYEEYHAKKILNVHKHVDGPWFWGKYTAHPYIGCRSGCEFCYCRGERYLGRRDPEKFDTLIQVKINAVELLRGELFGRERDVITVGDWQQPAEDRYRLSRRMLEVVRDLNFPLFIVERSPLLIRDLDLLVEINRQSWVGVVFSISSLDPALKRAFEPRSPGVKRRLGAMKKLAEAGILVGTALMPVLPFVGDGETHLEDVIRA